MSLLKFLDESSITRRSVLKGIGAAVATASVVGCGDGGDGDDTVAFKDNLDFERAERYAFNTGPFNCGAKCVHKFHIKNGRVFAMTSAGDITPVSTNENHEDNPDESCGEYGKPMQYRSCVRGYSYIQRIYQPDRLKYPLKQMGQKGDLNGFVRISWTQAFSEIADAYVAAFTRASSLGYVPTIDRMGITGSIASAVAISDPKNYVYIAGASNASNGNSEAAKLDALGGRAFRNSKSDALNAGLIIYWGADPTRHSNHENGSYFSSTKAKLAGVPAITISPVCTDQAVVYSSNVVVTIPATTFTDTTVSAKTVKIPGWVPIRPGTDGALAVAMMYAIYRRKIYDRKFLGDSTATGYVAADRKCFGFWAGDSITAPGHDRIGSGMGGSPYKSAPADAVADAYKGTTFTVPTGDSFEEYLASLESNDISDYKASTAAAVINANKDGAIEVDSSTYYSVLDKAARVTGVNPDIIEALAIRYAQGVTDPSGKPVRIDSGCGPQRQWNGAEFVWLMICLTAICGYSNKKGGGAAIGMGSYPDNSVFATSTSPVGGTTVNNRPNPTSNARTITVNDQNLAEIVLTGRDGRNATKFMNDVKWTVKDPAFTLAGNGVEVDIYTSSNSNRLTTQSNINKTIQAFKQIDCVVAVDDVMTPTTAHANYVFPSSSYWERPAGGSLGGQGDVKIRIQNILPVPMYDSWDPSKITAELGKAIVAKLRTANLITDAQVARYPGYTAPTDLDNTTAQQNNLKAQRSSNIYENAGNAPVVFTEADWTKIEKNGNVQINTHKDKPVLGLVHHTVPNWDALTASEQANRNPLDNSTGFINFYSPFWADRMSAPDYHHSSTDMSGWRTATAKYVPIWEGYDNMSNPAGPYINTKSGRQYTMQFMTNKARNRAHTAQDNVAIIKDQFVQKAYINPIDAAARGIRDGDMVYVYNERGCTKLPAAVTSYIVPGVVSVEHGSWYRASTTETVKVYPSDIDGNVPSRLTVAADGSITVPVDVGGAENVLTDDRFHYDVLYISQTASCHGGPVEVSLTKPQ